METPTGRDKWMGLAKRAAVFAVPLYFGFAFIGYGLAWKKLTSSTFVLTQGRNVAGTVESIQTEGFGIGKTHYIKLKEAGEAFMLPDSILHPLSSADHTPDVDLDRVLKAGDGVGLILNVSVYPPIIVDMTVNRPGGGEHVISNAWSQGRYIETLKQSIEIGNSYLMYGLICFALPLVYLAWIGRRRAREAGE